MLAFCEAEGLDFEEVMSVMPDCLVLPLEVSSLVCSSVWWTCLAFLAGEGGAVADLVALMQAIGTILVLPDQSPPLVEVRVQENLATCQ